MPRKSSLKPINLDEKEEEDEEDAAITAEEAQLRAARLQNEIEEQNKFDCLCDGVNSAIALVDSAFNGLLEFKDELLMHSLPPSLLASLVLVTGKMYRSITDLHTPVRELTRLVTVYSVPWEQKSEQLKKLHTDYESKQRQLNIAVRKLQLIDAAARRMEREKIVNNWEKVFAKVSAAKTHGRRWKFMIEAFKQKVKEGIIPGDLDLDDDDDEDDSERSESQGKTKKAADEDEEDQDEAAADKQRFMMSVITASPPQEDDTGSQPAGSDLGSDADGIPSEVTESSGNAEEMSPDLQPKPKRHGVSFGPVDEVAEEIVKPEMKDVGVWTNEPEYETRLAVRVFRPLEMTDDDSQDMSCFLTLKNLTQKTGVLPIPTLPLESLQTIEQQPESEEESKKTPKSKAGRRKSIGFASRPTTPPAPSSVKAKSIKPSSILKKLKSPDDDDFDENKEKKTENPTVDRSAYIEVFFPLPGDMNDTMKIAVLQPEKNTIMSMAILKLGDIDVQNLQLQFLEDTVSENTEQQKKSAGKNPEDSREKDPESKPVTEQSEEELAIESTILSIEPTFIDLQGIKVGIGVHGHSQIGKLPLVFYLVKKEIKRFEDKEASTESIKEIVKDVIGIDIDEISKDDLLHMLGREYHDVCTSAMSFASSSSHKSGYIAQEELETIQEQHDKELRGIQAEYEIKIQQLLLEMEEIQRAQSTAPVQIVIDGPHNAYENDMVAERQMSRREEVCFAAEDIQPEVTPIQRMRKQGPTLPDWGAHLPKNVWVRMKMLTEEMIEKRHQLEARVRRQMASNIEKKLASQYKLQRASNTLRGPLQDVCLPAVFMPSRNGNVYNPRAHMYFHPTGTSGDLRLSQPPSIFQLPPLPEKARVSVVNLFDLSKNFRQNASTDWLARIATVPQQSKGSRATTAATRVSRLATPNTPAPTANIPAFDVQ